jgi:hypothetical protein
VCRYRGNGHGKKEGVFLGARPLRCDQLDQLPRGTRGEVVLPRKMSGPREVMRSRKRVEGGGREGSVGGSLGQMRPV